MVIPCGFPLLVGIKYPDLHWNKQDKFKTWNTKLEISMMILLEQFQKKPFSWNFLLPQDESYQILWPHDTSTTYRRLRAMDFFFLQAFADSAADAIHTIDQLTALHDKNTKLFGTLTKWQRTRVLKVVSILINDGILAQTAKSGKAKIYSYIEYLDILRKDT